MKLLAVANRCQVLGQHSRQGLIIFMVLSICNPHGIILLLPIVEDFIFNFIELPPNLELYDFYDEAIIFFNRLYKRKELQYTGCPMERRKPWIPPLL